MKCVQHLVAKGSELILQPLLFFCRHIRCQIQYQLLQHLYPRLTELPAPLGQLNLGEGMPLALRYPLHQPVLLHPVEQTSDGLVLTEHETRYLRRGHCARVVPACPQHRRLLRREADLRQLDLGHLVYRRVSLPEHGPGRHSRLSELHLVHPVPPACDNVNCELYHTRTRGAT